MCMGKYKILRGEAGSMSEYVTALTGAVVFRVSFIFAENSMTSPGVYSFVAHSIEAAGAVSAVLIGLKIYRDRKYKSKW